MKNKQIGGDHYINMGVQPWDVVDGWTLDEKVGYYRGNALKYLLRMGNKEGNDPLVECEKAIHYLEKLAEVLRDAQRDYA